MNRHRSLSLAVLAVLVVAAACASSGSTSGGAGELPDAEWTLADGSVDALPIPVIDTAPITLRIEGVAVSGSAGCNSYSASLSSDAGAGTLLGPVALTRMACADGAVMAAEQAYVDGLGRAVTGTATDDGLVLSSEDVELRFVRTG